ncbi:MAG: hypothetical protein AAB922_02320 [Patescibacteria group bacterium]
MSDESTPALLARLRGRLRSDRFDTIVVQRADQELLVAMAEAAEGLAEALRRQRKHHNADIMCPKATDADAECYCGADDDNEDIDPALAAWDALAWEPGKGGDDA